MSSSDISVENPKIRVSQPSVKISAKHGKKLNVDLACILFKTCPTSFKYWFYIRRNANLTTPTVKRWNSNVGLAFLYCKISMWNLTGFFFNSLNTKTAFIFSVKKEIRRPWNADAAFFRDTGAYIVREDLGAGTGHKVAPLTKARISIPTWALLSV